MPESVDHSARFGPNQAAASTGSLPSTSGTLVNNGAPGSSTAWSDRFTTHVWPPRRNASTSAPRRQVKLEIDLNKSMPALFAEESHAIDISYITDELDVYVTGGQGLEIFPSPLAAHMVEASQNKGEYADTTESILQSGTCRHKAGIHWRSKNTKLGYRYDIRFVGRKSEGRR